MDVALTPDTYAPCSEDTGRQAISVLDEKTREQSQRIRHAQNVWEEKNSC